MVVPIRLAKSTVPGELGLTLELAVVIESSWVLVKERRAICAPHGETILAGGPVLRQAHRPLLHQFADGFHGRVAVAEELLVELLQIEGGTERLLLLLAQFHDVAVAAEIA